MGNDSISKTFGVALALCVVCAVVVSSAAVILRPTQEVNKLLDLKTNILASAGLLQEGVSIETQFEQISTRVVDLADRSSLPMRLMRQPMISARRRKTRPCR